jgi:hypothetical protein
MDAKARAEAEGDTSTNIANGSAKLNSNDFNSVLSTWAVQIGRILTHEGRRRIVRLEDN